LRGLPGIASLSEGTEFSVRFWGVRGSIPSPGGTTARYGGNTSCVEMRCGPNLLIFDAGSGIRELGNSLEAGGAVDADLFLSHTHYDHLVGLPFFGPVFNPRNSFRVWAGHLKPERTIESVLRGFMTDPLFPVPLDIFNARIDFHDFIAGDSLQPRSDISVQTTALNHPNRATGFRVEYGGKAACYVTDTEHVIGSPDRNILGLIEGADLMIYDSSFTDDEFPNFIGWGHSTWEEAVRLAQAAHVKRVAVFHHEPSRDDDVLDAIGEAAQRMYSGALIAREGDTLTL
jgi:phosphoribosyl 1,2-cyclic phosphodiesterase